MLPPSLFSTALSAQKTRIKKIRRNRNWNIC